MSSQSEKFAGGIETLKKARIFLDDSSSENRQIGLELLRELRTHPSKQISSQATAVLAEYDRLKYKFKTNKARNTSEMLNTIHSLNHPNLLGSSKFCRKILSWLWILERFYYKNYQSDSKRET